MIDGGTTTLQMCPHLDGLDLQVLTKRLSQLQADSEKKKSHLSEYDRSGKGLGAHTHATRAATAPHAARLRLPRRSALALTAGAARPR